MFLLNDKPLPLDTPFTTDDGTQFPANWLRLSTAEEKEAIGITEVADAPAYDDRFYWGVDNPKDLASLKTAWVEQCKQTAYSLLLSTDYKIVRFAETGQAVDQATLDFRTAVRSYYQSLKTGIEATVTVEELIAIVTAQDWPSVNPPQPA